MTATQARFIQIAKAYGADGNGAEYWPVANDWVRDCGRAKSLALRNINRTVDALIRRGVIHIDDDGLIHLGEASAKA
jgi:hypothetical protein